MKYELVKNSGRVVSLLLIVLVLQFNFNSSKAQVVIKGGQTVCVGTGGYLFADVCASKYNVSDTGAFAPLPDTGQILPMFNNTLSAAIPIGFNFNFFCDEYNELFVSANGFLTFDIGSGSGCCYGALLPNTFIPNNLIAFAWGYLGPSAGGTFDYVTIGNAPERKFILNLKDVPHWPGFANLVTLQVILYEKGHTIEIHTTTMPTTGSAHTMGIENADGTIAFFPPGRNASGAWSATNELISFKPLDYSIAWSTTLDATIIGINDSLKINPLFTTSYIASVTYSDNSKAKDTLTITVFPSPTADFSYTINGNMLWCHDQSSKAVVWEWDFDNGNTAKTASAFNYYSKAGKYDVSQVVTNSLLCTDTAIKTVNITLTGIEDGDPNIQGFTTFPNPFAGETQITYSLLKKAEVKLEVFNILGEQVRVLFEGDQSAGNYNFTFNGYSNSSKGSRVGVYIIKLTVNGSIYSARVVEFD
ncbi:MAG: T9SS type A sorting domain-containing protein [Bacteroidetes bacterium]|nr:T9SS type A sorting domain-containing protein [Bacteroidota bacterium]